MQFPFGRIPYPIWVWCANCIKRINKFIFSPSCVYKILSGEFIAPSFWPVLDFNRSVLPEILITFVQLNPWDFVLPSLILPSFYHAFCTVHSRLKLVWIGRTFGVPRLISPLPP